MKAYEIKEYKFRKALDKADTNDCQMSDTDISEEYQEWGDNPEDR